MNFDYRKPLREQDDKWWLHQYCISKGISATSIKTKDRLKLDLQNNNTVNVIVDSESTNNKLHLIFNEFDINMMNEFYIDGYYIKAYEVEEFREDMIACAVSLGLLQSLNNEEKDKEGRALNLLRQISTAYSTLSTDIFEENNSLDEDGNEVSINKFDKKIEEWTKYCRLIDISINKFTKNPKWKNYKNEILADLRKKVASDIYASAFVQFYSRYKKIDKKTQAKANKLLELNLPNIDDIETAKKVVKYSTLANVSSLKK